MKTKYKIAIVGDSHTKEWVWLKKHFYSKEIDIVLVNKKPGKTAQGLCKQENIDLLLDPIRELKTQLDYLLIYLGEVDCGSALWLKAKRNSSNVKDELTQAIQNLIKMAKAAQEEPNVNKVILMAPVLPLVENYKDNPGMSKIRKSITASWDERNKLTKDFCKLLKGKATKENILYCTVNHLLIDKETSFVKQEIIENHSIHHHLKTEYGAKLWLKQIEKLITNQEH